MIRIAITFLLKHPQKEKQNRSSWFGVSFQTTYVMNKRNK